MAKYLDQHISDACGAMELYRLDQSLQNLGLLPSMLNLIPQQCSLVLVELRDSVESNRVLGGKCALAELLEDVLEFVLLCEDLYI